MRHAFVCFRCLFFLFFCLWNLSVFNANGQTSGKENYIPKTPEIAYFERYGNIAVDEYSGIHSTSINLHTIQNKDIDFPLRLLYTSGGIQVSQEATWVGLGWNLTLLGSISAIPVGGPDDVNFSANQRDIDSVVNYSPYNSAFPKIFPNLGLIGMVEGNCGNAAPAHPLINIPNNSMLIENDKGNTERDLYRVNLLGRSFEVFIKPVTNQIYFKGEKLPYKVSFQNNSWEIVDDKGYRFFFSTKEQYQIQGYPNSSVNTWHLTKVYHQSRLLIDIVYDDWTVIPLPTLSEIRYIHVGDYVFSDFGSDLIKRKVSYVDRINAKYPKYIISGLDSIVFEKGTRTDLTGSPRLSELSVFSRADKSLVKKISFKTGYFEGAAVGAETSSQNNITKRLKLDSVLIFSNQDKPLKYRFTYFPGLPHKNSFSQDFWGYFNGADNTVNRFIDGGAGSIFSENRTLIPRTSSLAYENVIPDNLLSNTGADRGVSKTLITAGSLKSIQYPSGGMTEFEYEPHLITNAKYVERGKSPLTDGLKNIINNGNSSFSTPMLEFTLEKTVKAKLKVFITGKSFTAAEMGSFGVTLVTNIGPTPTIRSYRINTPERIAEFNLKKSISIEEEVELPAGRVIFSSSVGAMPDQGYVLNNGVQASLSFVDVNYQDNNESFAGGLRIKNITNYDSPTKASTKRSYQYTLQGQPSGKLIQPLKLFYKRTYLYLVGGSPLNGIVGALARPATYQHILSANKNTFHDSFSPSHVGYNKVRVIEQNLADGSLSYTTELAFINQPLESIVNDSKFLPKDSTKYATNGKIEQKTMLNHLADTVLSEVYKYAVNNKVSYPVNVLFDRKFIGSFRTNYCGQANIAKNNQFNIVVYPYYNFNVQLTSKTTRKLFQGNVVITSEFFEYNPKNYLISKQRKTISRGTEDITEIKYAVDYTGSNEQLMVVNNMVSIPIEEKTSSNGKIKNYSRTDYAAFGNLAEINPTAIYDIDKNSSLVLQVGFMDYDKYGNPLQIKHKSGIPIVYLWGYGGQYPVAKIENATHAEVVAAFGGTAAANTIFSSLNQPGVSESTIRTHVQTLRTKLTKAQVSTYTYKPLVGMTGMTDPRGITETYQYDGFQRLKNVLDFENNILKDYRYNYRP